MNKYQFIDIVKKEDGFLRGPFGSALKKSLFVPKGVDTYKVYEQSTPLYQDEKLGNYYISKEYFDNSMYKFEAKPKDFLVSCSGVNYGAIYQLSDNAEKGVINQALLRIRLDNNIVDDDYFLYLFNSYIVKRITSGTGDSTIPNFPPMSVVKAIEFDLPDLPTQKKIAKKIKCIDKKIVNNNKINLNLESLAKTVFDYWFLQFEFPNEKRKPYKSSGGKMIYNKIVKKEIPEGWEVKQLKDIVIENNKSKTQVGQVSNSGDYPFFTSGEEILKSDKHIINGNCCYLSTGGNATLQHHVGKADYSTDTWCITANNNLENYLYLYLKSILPMMDTKFFHGTGLKHLQKPLLLKEFVVIPDENILKLFNNYLSKGFERQSLNYIENQKLKGLKEFLLPMLMNNQITFSD